MNHDQLELINEASREKFEAAWLGGNPIPIEDCLPPDTDPGFLPTLEELVHIDLEFIWQNSRSRNDQPDSNPLPNTVESYINKFHQLQDDQIVLRLVEQEMRCRKSANQNVKLDDYSHRFPKLTAGIQALVTVIEGEAQAAGKTPKPNMKIGEQVGRYLIADRQGEGGFGLVWQADDPKLGRRIAIKQLSNRLVHNEEQRLRFINEARIAARLEHPGVVPVYDVEQSDQQHPYYTMKLVRGKTLEEEIQNYHNMEPGTEATKLAGLRLLNVYTSICRAMQYSHDNGVIHRDLKPQNVVLGDYGETIILDWGLAKTVDDDSTSESGDVHSAGGIQVTSPGSVMGTPAYMSPEQATGTTVNVDRRSDIYSLGVILFQILTGRLPYDATTGDEMIAKVLAGDAEKPRNVLSSIPKPIAAICERAMRHNIDARFQKVHELVMEMEKFLADEKVESYQESFIERIQRWGRKNRTWVMAATVGLLVLTIGSIVASVLINEQRKIAKANEAAATEARRLESIAKEDAIDAKENETDAKLAAQTAAENEKLARIKEQEQRELAQWQLSRLYIKDGLRSIEKIDYATAALWFAESLKLTAGTEDESLDRIRMNSTLRRQTRLANLFVLDLKRCGPIVDLRFSQDESRAHVLCQNVFESYDLETGKVIVSVALGDTQLQRFGADPELFVTVDKSYKNPNLNVYNVNGETVAKCVLNADNEQESYSVSNVALAKNNQRVAVCFGEGIATKSPKYSVATWNLDEPEKQITSSARTRRFYSCVFSPDSNSILTGGGDHTACVWNARTGELEQEFKHSEFYPRESAKDFRVLSDAKYSPNGKHIVTASSDNIAYVWDVEAKQKKYELSHGPKGIFGDLQRVEFSPTGELVATADNLYSTRVWNYVTGQFVGKYDNFTGSINDFSFFKNTLVLTCSRNGYCKFWSPRNGDVVPAMRHAGAIVAARVDSSGNRFLTAGEDQTVRFWDAGRTQLGSSRRYIRGEPRRLFDKFVISGDDKYLVTSSRLGDTAKVQIWDYASLKQIGNDIELPHIVGHLIINDDNRRLLLTCTDPRMAIKTHFAQVYQLDDGEPVSKKLNHESKISAAGFVDGTDNVFTSSLDRTAIVWDVSDSSVTQKFEHSTGVNTASLAGNGNLLVTGCQDKSVHFWSIATGQKHCVPFLHDYAVARVICSTDSKRVITQGYSSDATGVIGSLALIDLSNGKKIGDSVQHDSYLPPNIRPDSKVFSAFGKTSVSIHRLEDGTRISTIQHRGEILGCTWHPLKQQFATCANDKTVQIWEIDSGKAVTPAMNYVGVPFDLHFNSSGRMLMSRLTFGDVVRVWDAKTGEPLTPDFAHGGWAEPIAFARDGKEIVVGGSLMSMWNLSEFPESVERTQQLVELLSGQKVDSIGGLTPLTTEDIRTRFESVGKQ